MTNPDSPNSQNHAPKSSPDPEFVKQFGEAIQSYADAISNDRPEEAEQAAMQALLMAGEEALKNPTPSLLLKEEAQNCEAKGDWAGAEAAYRQVLTLEQAAGHFAMIAKAHLDLARLERVLGRLEEACESAKLATSAARQANMFPVLVMALDCQAHCALESLDFPAAWAAASEAVEVIEPGKIHDSMRAKALVTRAKCSVLKGDPGAAHVDLTASWQLLQARASSFMRGPILGLAYWWDAKSHLEEHRGNLDAAKEAMHRAIDHFQKLNGPYARFAAVRALRRLSQLLTQAGDLLGAERASSGADSIRRELGVP